MMETMNPPQVGMRLQTKKKLIIIKKRKAKKRGGPKNEKIKIIIKNERKREKGQCYYLFFHTCASK